MNKPDLIRYLIDQGMPHKMVCLITHSKQPYVSKVASGKLHSDTTSAPNFTPEELNRFNAIRRIYELHSLPTQGITENDEQYIHLLKYCMVDKDKIYALYNDLSKKRFAQIYTSKKIDFRKFDSTLLDISPEVFQDLFQQVPSNISSD